MLLSASSSGLSSRALVWAVAPPRSIVSIGSELARRAPVSPWVYRMAVTSDVSSSRLSADVVLRAVDDGLRGLGDLGEDRRLGPGLLERRQELLEPEVAAGDDAAGDREPADLVVHLASEDRDAHGGLLRPDATATAVRVTARLTASAG